MLKYFSLKCWLSYLFSYANCQMIFRESPLLGCVSNFFATVFSQFSTSQVKKLKLKNSEIKIKKKKLEIMSLSTEKYPGEPICILSFETSNLVSTYDFNTGRLKKILSQRQVMDRNIVVISIVGAFRKGKSFLLDYCLRYLYTNVSLDFNI